MSNYYNRIITLPIYFRHGNMKYYKDIKIQKYIESNHLVFKLGKAKDILLDLAYKEEIYSHESNYSMVWDESLEFSENLRRNNLLSLWDSGSVIFEIKPMEN